MTRKLTTCHADPWALIRRGGDTEGKRLSTRMAYLVGTVIGPDGKALAMTGYIMNTDMTNWTKHPRRIDWADVIKRWQHQPKIATVKKVKSSLPIATPETPLAAGSCRRVAYDVQC